MKDVAAAAGVSTTTASLVMNDKAESITPATARRVRQAATDLGYRPNRLAQSLRRQRSHTVGMVSDEIATTPFAGAMIRGAQEAAWNAGHVLVLIDTEGERAIENAGIEALIDRQVEGLLYARMRHQLVELPDLPRQSVNMVLLNARCRDESIPSVAPDEVGGARTAIEHLLAAGHRRIGYIQSPDPVPAAKERLMGYRAALEDAGITVDETLVVLDQAEGERPVVEIDRLLSRPDPPTAVFCFNDRMAFGIYKAARRLGLSIPEQLSVVGFDNMETVARWLDPALTTVQLPHYEMGRLTIEMLERLIDGEEIDDAQYRMPCPLVERASVGAPPSGREVVAVARP